MRAAFAVLHGLSGIEVRSREGDRSTSQRFDPTKSSLCPNATDPRQSEMSMTAWSSDFGRARG
ncbi:hypothetical protein ASG60_16640 [Methylobacterium sp. Leaf469]|nr:hypothetical protein ASG60_16640 [Methylobacterium sp. Leaf469]